MPSPRAAVRSPASNGVNIQAFDGRQYRALGGAGSNVNVSTPLHARSLPGPSAACCAASRRCRPVCSARRRTPCCSRPQIYSGSGVWSLQGTLAKQDSVRRGLASSQAGWPARQPRLPYQAVQAHLRARTPPRRLPHALEGTLRAGRCSVQARRQRGGRDRSRERPCRCASARERPGKRLLLLLARSASACACVRCRAAVPPMWP